MEDLRYEPNPKHKEPWQPGRKGSLCPPVAELSLQDAARMLKVSVKWGEKRYAHHDGRAYAAQEHEPGRWHGYPVGWVEVPTDVRNQWLKSDAIKKRHLSRYWISHTT